MADPRTIAVPAPLAAVIEELAQRYAERAGEDLSWARRVVEISAIQRGLKEIQRELDEVAPVAVEPKEKVA